WLTPPGGRPSGSNIRIAKLLVPSGGFDQFSAGDTFSPTQFGLDLLLPAFFTASRSPSLKLGEDRVNTLWALAGATLKAANATAPARIEPRRNMISPIFIAFTAFALDGVPGTARFWRAECSQRPVQIKPIASSTVMRGLTRASSNFQKK